MTRCGECGYDWAAPRAHATAAIAVLPVRLSRLVLDLGLSDDDRRVRSKPARALWSPLEYIAHTADTIGWYADRVDRALTEDRPGFDGFDWDAYTRDQRYHDRRLDEVLQAVDLECTRLAAQLGQLTEADWCREGVGSDGGARSVALLAHRAAHEAKHHLRDIARGLMGRGESIRQERRALLVSDLDGTLLRPDGDLGQQTIKVVNEFVAQGGLFTYATARSFATASRVTRGLNLTVPVITYGGAVLVDPVTESARPAQVVGAETARAVIELAEQLETAQLVMFVTHEERDRVCWNAANATVGAEAFLAKRQGDPRLMPLQDWSEIDLGAVFYISVIGDYEPLAELRPLIPTDGVHVMFSQDDYSPTEWWIQISASRGTKAAALAGLAQELEIDELICFGDNHNDLPMFAIADQAIAVSNATPTVHAAATHVIKSNSDEGVALWIAKLMAPTGGGKRATLS